MAAQEPKLAIVRGASDAAAPLAFEDALARHLDTLFSTARLLTGEVAAAEDLVQDTALAAFRAWGDLRAPEAVKAWLLRILHNAFVSSRRHARRRPPFVDIAIDELLTHPLLAAEPAALGEILSNDVAAALDALPVEFRVTVWLIDVEELGVAEAAEVLGVPVGTAASRVYRARQLLRARLEKK